MIGNRRGTGLFELILVVLFILGGISGTILGIDTEPAATAPEQISDHVDIVLHTGRVANVEYPVIAGGGYGPTVITFEDGAIYTLPGTTGWRPVSVWKGDQVSIISTPHGIALNRSWP